MIYKAYQTELDKKNIFINPKNPAPINFDYRNLVVNKPWGYEYLMYDNNDLAIWILYLKPEEETSMHCHPNKKTSLAVLSGLVNVSTLKDKYLLTPQDALLIDKATFHSSKALSKNGLFLMEIETPSNKGDLLRLNDKYGRQGKAYEGIANLSFDLKNYEYSSFALNENGRKKINSRYIEILHTNNYQEFLKNLVTHPQCLMTFLSNNFDVLNLNHINIGDLILTQNIIELIPRNEELSKPISILTIY